MRGIVQSHTVIRVPDRAHAAMAPFVMLLVDVDGKRVLGHFAGMQPPEIGSTVWADEPGTDTPVFRIKEIP